MGIGDKIKNEAEDMGGRAKESAGAASGDRDLKREGQADQGEAKAKKVGENIKDAGKNVKDAFS